MKCMICTDEVKEIHARERHLIVTKDCQDGNVHIHGDLSDEKTMTEFLETTQTHLGITPGKQKMDREEIVFHNRQRIGDMLMFTCAVRDFKKAFPEVKVNVISTAAHIFDHNPYIDRSVIPMPENTVKIGPGALTNASNRIDWHFANAFRVSIEKALGVSIPQGESRPDIWFTKEEYEAPPLFDFPYWVIVIGGEKGWGCKMYPFEKWQEFVNQNPTKTFVQVGAKEDDHPRLQGANIIDHVGKTQDGKTGIRDLFKLFLNAEGSIGLVSFHMHLSGALYKPCIVVAGAREPVSFTRYPGHAYMSSDGMLPCAEKNACWHCNITACKNLVGDNVPKCVDIIDPADLTLAIDKYYRGGRLKIGECSAKPKLKNIIEKPVEIPVSPGNPDIGKYGLPWGGGSVTEKDWQFMIYLLKKHKVKTVLEFGAGLSTLLLNEFGFDVITFEDRQGWIDKIKKLSPEADIRLWDGKTIEREHPDLPIFSGTFDFAFVDGPAGGGSREESTKIASIMANMVIIHDANREKEREWQDKYIVGGFEGPVKGGNRCHLWTKCDVQTVKKDAEEAVSEPEADVSEQAEEIILKPGKDPETAKTSKYIKVVSTARGWGGCARSITTIMKHLVKAGHTVEFIPFRNSVGSREFKAWLQENPEIIVTENYATISSDCDVLFMYADDYVWEFDKPDVVEVFSEINADRKVMMINYRQGGIGKIEWTKGWDKYMFLNSKQKEDLVNILPAGTEVKVLAPCTELEDFLKITPDSFDYVQDSLYDIKLIRHSSQGDTKYSKDFGSELDKILTVRCNCEVHLMPGPSFVEASPRVIKYLRNTPPIPEFLSKGNLFWYSLPEMYMDMGPRVILEAMAAGLPVIADNWGGAVDRVTPDTGWLCNTKEEQAEIIKNISMKTLKKMGMAAKEHARAEFVPEKWVQEILN